MPVSIKDVEKNTNKRTVERNPIPKGNHVAILAKVIDFGLQPRAAWQGKEKPPAYEVELTFEFPKFTIDVDGEAKPMHLSKRITMSAFKESNCVKMYSILDPDNEFKGDFGKCIGTAVMATVVHDVGKGKYEGRTFDKIAGISPFPDIDGLEKPSLYASGLVFDTSNPDLAVWDTLPEWVHDRIKSGPEFKGSKLDKMLQRRNGNDPGDDVSAQVSDAAVEDGAEPTFDDDIPW